MIIRPYRTNIGSFLVSSFFNNHKKTVKFIFSIFARMEKVYNHYREKIEAYSRHAEGLKKKIHWMGSIRLALFAGAIAALYIFRAEEWDMLSGIIALFALPFIALMFYHTKLAFRKNYAETLIKLCQNELKALDYDFSAFDGAPEKTSADHSFSLDLDLFGERSLFQSVNRTVTFIGKEKLIDWFQNPLTDKQQILKRQEAVRELESFTQLRQHFYVTGTLQPGNQNDIRILSFLNSASSGFFNKRIWKILIWTIPAIWILLAIAAGLNLIAPALLGIFFALSFLIAYSTGKKTAELHNNVNKMEKILSTYANLMKCVEGDLFKSEELSDISRTMTGYKKTASEAIKQLSGYIGALDQRFSFMGIILNIFTLRDTRTAIKLENWKLKHKSDLFQWFEALACFDAYCSLGGFAFNHPDYIYPEIADTYFKMEGTALGHPLLRRDVCVKNDIAIHKSPWFLIITGANMAGKSTYLRTVGVNYLLACIGTPVCAERLTIYPAHMVTSLRTADSLMSNESYFFAELKRLKMIINRLQQGEELFIILDEILKGTNSIDKQKGSLALMKQLVAYRTCGIIATHDLALGELEQEFPEQIKNYRFEADITGDKLTFSYKLREGVAQNMNACFLMNQMGITIPQ
mgnify:CR=1 FL=1